MAAAAGVLAVLCASLLGAARADNEHTMYVGGTFQSVGIPGTAGIARLDVNGNDVSWASVGNGVYSPDRKSEVHAVAMLDAENEVLVGGDFMMAGFVIGSDNVDNQTAAWGFAHFNGANWRPGWNGLRMVASSVNVVRTMLHTHVYKNRVWQEHVFVGGQFYARVKGGNFIANLAHWDGKQWRGLVGEEAPLQSSLPITAIMKYGGTSGNKVMIGAKKYFRFYDAAYSRLESTCKTDKYDIRALTSLCNGWVYAAIDDPPSPGSEGTKRFSLDHCKQGSGDAAAGGYVANDTWRPVPEPSTGCELSGVSDLLCVDDTVVAVGNFKYPVYRAAVYNTKAWSHSERVTPGLPRQLQVSSEEQPWQGNSSCCQPQSTCVSVCESECPENQRPSPELFSVTQNPSEPQEYWVGGAQEAGVASGAPVARVGAGSNAGISWVQASLQGGVVNTIQAISSAGTYKPMGYLFTAVLVLCAMLA